MPNNQRDQQSLELEQVRSSYNEQNDRVAIGAMVDETKSEKIFYQHKDSKFKSNVPPQL